ncbi:FimV family protein [Massilia sp. TS11]|uniref:type IV pilus assembly protein FimV n=1 Tax=Massilia sp. TS11 TaxID=2908003 RepID=UPI001EDA5384|nr:hypothetical protein [Massilia sp. TS11]MCG2585642.1 hypothetical protein [Massilia sp. TS11]
MKALSYIHTLRTAGAALVLALAAAAAHAAELGEPVVKSYIGQPIIADIELLQPTEEDLNSLNVRLARQDVYRGANVAMDPVLSYVHMSVMRRDGKMFLHVTSVRPVQSNYLHLYLELSNSRQQIVRLATLWFDQDPRPPAPVTPPEPAAALTEEPPPSPALQAAIERARRQVSYPKPAPEPSGACGRSARTCAILATRNAELNAQLAALESKVKTLQAGLGASASASASASAKASASAAAAEHEAADSASAHGDASASASAHAEAAPPPVHEEASASAAHPAAASAKASKNGKAEKKGPQTDWVMLGSIGGAVLALAGGGWFMLSRKKAKKGKKDAAPKEGKPGLMAKVFGRLRRKESKGAAPAPEQHEEPSLES